MSERRCPAINVWKCEVCNALTVAIDIDEGVTPFMLGCRANDKCKGMGQSSFYPEPPIPAHIASALAWEWYAPSPEERATDIGNHLKAMGMGGSIEEYMAKRKGLMSGQQPQGLGHRAPL